MKNFKNYFGCAQIRPQAVHKVLTYYAIYVSRVHFT